MLCAMRIHIRWLKFCFAILKALCGNSHCGHCSHNVSRVGHSSWAREWAEQACKNQGPAYSGTRASSGGVQRSVLCANNVINDNNNNNNNNNININTNDSNHSDYY